MFFFLVYGDNLPDGISIYFPTISVTYSDVVAIGTTAVLECYCCLPNFLRVL